MRPARRDGDGRSGGVTGDVNERSRLCRGYTEGTMPKPPQFVAAVVAGLTVRVVGGHEANASVAGAGRMLIAEFLFTFALCWVVLNVATAWSNIWIYFIAEFLGGAAAAYTFLYLLPAEKATGDIEAASTR
jgi:hypothetical protein